MVLSRIAKLNGIARHLMWEILLYAKQIRENPCLEARQTHEVSPCSRGWKSEAPKFSYEQARRFSCI